jgi:hypothetical protein
MNTKSLLTKGAVVAGGLGLLGGLGATMATSASASTFGPTVVASTHAAGLPDTTVGSTATGSYEDANGNMTTVPTQSVYGPVWAIDNLKETYKVTPLGGDQYQVDRMVNGTFVAFAQPNTGSSVPSPLDAVEGQVHGTISYVVTSAVGPIGSLPADEPAVSATQPPTGSHAQLKQLFPGLQESGIQGGNDWVFAYHTAHGSMTQRWNTDPTTWGNITG